MRTSIHVQNVTKVFVGAVKTFTANDGHCSDFATREITLTGDNGDETVVTVYAAKVHTLAVVAEKGALDGATEAPCIDGSGEFSHAGPPGPSLEDLYKEISDIQDDLLSTYKMDDIGARPVVRAVNSLEMAKVYLRTMIMTRDAKKDDS